MYPVRFTGALTGIEAMKKAGLEFQINTTITKANLNQLEGIMDLAINLGAAAHHIFLLVPTGRGKEMAEQAISPGDYEKTLNWFYETSLHCPIQLKATCAPHYYRIYHQKRKGDRGQGQGTRKSGSGKSVSCHDARLPRGYFFLLYFSHGAGAALRLSGARLRPDQRARI